MADYISREAAAQILRKEAANHYPTPFHVGLLAAARVIEAIPAADVLPRDEAIKMGAELAAMHGSDATSQQLEEAYLKGVEDGMTRRDVRPAVKAHWYWDKDGMDWGIGAWRCDNCKSKAETWWASDKKYNPLRCSGGKFCGNCGAAMYGGK